MRLCGDRRRCSLRGTSLVSMLAILSVVVTQIHAMAANAAEPLLPSVRASVEQRTAGSASTYDLKVSLDPGKNTISGTERVDFVNLTGEPQGKLYFRLYPNASYYGEGGIAIERARVNGDLVSPAFSEQDTVMTLPMTRPLAPNKHVAIALRMTIVVPDNSDGTLGIFSHRTQTNMWALADWYPIVAGWEDGYGWHLEPPSPYGDPTFSNVGSYNIVLDLPKGWTPAATGTQTATTSDGDRTEWSIVTGPVREFTMVIDDDFVTQTKTVDGTAITVYTDASEDASGGEIALDEATKVLPFYSKEFGPYPYTELDLVETHMDGALGISWTGLVYLNDDQLLASPFYVQTAPDRLRFTVAHEIGHEWWGAVVGINSNDYTFLLEGMTNYLAIAATEATEGTAAGATELQEQCVQPYLDALQQYGDGVANLTGTPPAGGPPRTAIIYGKAALGFLAIREAIGDDAFFGAIRAWAKEHAYRIGTPDELLAEFNSVSGHNVTAIWNAWFNVAGTTPDDVRALVASEP